MANNRLRLDGLAQLLDELRKLPQELWGDGTGIVVDAADGAAAEIHAAYPERTGDLRNKVKVVRLSTGSYAVAVKVENTSKHAAAFENGTQARHTSLGANRGSMPPGHVFVPVVQRRRRLMYARLKSMLVLHGLTVTGDV